MSKIAMCPTCKVPLVCTILFSGAEFYCLDCGRTFGWFDPTPTDITPELFAECGRRVEEWEPYAKALLTGGVMKRGCEKCSHGQSHIDHATPEELEAHAKALVWLKERVKA